MKILILGTTNSARSILLESIFNYLGKGRISAFSAGVEPIACLQPNTLPILKAKGYPQAGLHPKNWRSFTETDMDAVISVRHNTGTDASCYGPGAPLTSHWKIENPAAIASSPSATRAAYDVVFSMLEARAKAWLSLDFERMTPADRQYHLTRIGEASLVM